MARGLDVKVRKWAGVLLLAMGISGAVWGGGGGGKGRDEGFG